MINLTAVRFNS